MIGESNQNVVLIQIDASNFPEFEISEFEISRFDCSSEGRAFACNAGDWGSIQSQVKLKDFKIGNDGFPPLRSGIRDWHNNCFVSVNIM